MFSFSFASILLIPQRYGFSAAEFRLRPEYHFPVVESHLNDSIRIMNDHWLQSQSDLIAYCK